LNKIGAVLLCYLLGIIIGNTNILPDSFMPLLNTLSEVTVVIALPLLLFSLNVKSWFQIAGKAILSMVLAMTAVVAIAFFIFTINKGGRPEDAWQLAGMSIGVYTGGTPNLASIKTALGVSGNTYILFHTYDTLIALLYLPFVLSVGQKFFNKFLPKFESSPKMKEILSQDNQEMKPYREMFHLKVWPKLLGALVLSGVSVGTAVLLGGLIPQEYSLAVIILIITSLGILFSFVGPIRRIPQTFDLGMYIIYIFCIVVASMTDMSQLVTIDWGILRVVFFTTFGSMALHAIFCKLFKVDTDTFLVTSVSAICSPPFVPLVAGAIKNQRVILSGLTTGIIGYAIGNYLGITLAYLFKALT